MKAEAEQFLLLLSASENTNKPEA